MNHNNGDAELDLYAILKIDRTASFNSIQRAYKSLSRNFHPDKRRLPADKESAEDFFVAIKLAHGILSDPILRLAYDHGGLLAVDIVRRSDLSASQQNDESKHNSKNDGTWQDSTNDDDEEKDDDKENYYGRLQKSKTKEEAVRFIRELVEEYKIQRFILQKAPIGAEAELVHTFDPATNNLQSKGLGSFRVNAQRSLFGNKKVECSISGQTQIQLAQRKQKIVLAAARTSSFGLSYRGDAASHHHAECILNQTNPAHSQLSLQSTRRFVGGNMISIGVGGGLVTQPSTWVYSVTTNRIVLLGSLLQTESKKQRKQHSHTSKYYDSSSSHASTPRDHRWEDTKLHLSWTLGTTLTGEIRSIAATIRNLTFPQYKCRLGLMESPPLKVTFDSEEENNWHVAWSWDFSWWRIKVSKEHELGSHGNWSLRYGFKYDARGIQMGQAWSILLHLQSSDDWHLRVPITIRQIGGPLDYSYWEWPVTFTLLSLLGDWIEESFPDWWRRNVEPFSFLDRAGGGRAAAADATSSSSSSSWWRQVRHQSSATSLDTTGNNALALMLADVIPRIAEKKRQHALLHDGLVILRATWYPQQQQQQINALRRDRRHGRGGKMEEDVTDLLQYWVVDNRLHLPLRQCILFFGREQPTQSTVPVAGIRWLFKWFWTSQQDSRNEEVVNNAGNLYVRYQWDGSVYEIYVQSTPLHDADGNDEDPTAATAGPLVILPHTTKNDATRMGSVGQVE